MMKVTSSFENRKKKKVLTKKVSKKKKEFKDPFLRELDKKKTNKTVPSPSTSPLPIPTDVVDEDDVIVSRTVSNKTHIARLLPKTRLQLPSHVLRPARTFAQCPSMSVVINEPTHVQQRQLPTVCSRGARNFHARRLGTVKRIDNEYRLGQTFKRAAGKIKIDRL